jgi:hypothetical protein
MTQVFISYSRKDLKFVKRLAGDLKAAGFSIWYDLSGLDGGTTWGSEIQSAIEKSRFFLVVLSPNSIVSKWVQREFLFAEDCRLKIIPLQYLPCRMPMWMLDLQSIDLRGRNYSLNFERLLKALGGPPPPVKPPVEEIKEAQGQDREVRPVEKKQTSQAELEAKQAERAALQAKKEVQARERQARQEQQERAQAEERLRRQAEEQLRQAANRSRREQAWRAWKPRLPRLAGLGGLGILVIAAIFLAPGFLRGLPARPQPTATVFLDPTFTATPESIPSTNTPPATASPTIVATALPTSLPTIRPTASFDPLLSYINSHDPTFMDDFSNKQIKPGWGGNTSEGYGLSPDMLTDDNTLLIRDYIEPNYTGTAPVDYYVPGVSFPFVGLFDAADFVLQFEVKINDLNSAGIQFRSTLSLDTSTMEAGYRFTLYSSGDWDLKKNLNEAPISEGHQRIDPGTFNKVLLITKGKYAYIFLNTQLLYEGDELSTSHTSNRIFVYNNPYQSPGSNFWKVAGAEFDDFKFWNLDGVDL